MSSQEAIKQVGGTHYKADYQHWDLVVDNEIPYLEACATKYLSRWRAKGGVQDLLKAESYIDKRILCCILSDYKYHRQVKVNPLQVRRWFSEAHISGPEQEACWLLLCWETVDDLRLAKVVIRAIIDHHNTTHAEIMGGMPTKHYTNQG